MTDERPKSDIDPLYLEKVYPEPGAIFEFVPRPPKDALADAIFVLDTNTLLVPYGTDPAGLDAIRDAYSRLLKDGRLRVPAHVAREFAKNRPERLKTLYDKLAKRQSVNYERTQYPPLLAELPEFKALEAAETEFDAKLRSYRAAIKTVLDRVRGWYWDDPVSSMYSKIFKGNVVVDLKLLPGELSKDFAFRSLHKIAPGYKDAGKEVNAEGDLIVWRTILEIGRTEKRDLFFVAGDEKPDWWYRTSEGALYPRFELLDEYRRISEGKAFYIVALADLLKEFGAKPEVVDAVRDEELSFRPITLPSKADWAPAAVAAVVKWLAQQGAVDVAGSGYIKLRRADGSQLNAEVRLVQRPARAVGKVGNALSSAREQKAQPYSLVLVARDHRDADRLLLTISEQLRAKVSPGYDIVLGCLEKDAVFLPLGFFSAPP